MRIFFSFDFWLLLAFENHYQKEAEKKPTG